MWRSLHIDISWQGTSLGFEMYIDDFHLLLKLIIGRGHWPAWWLTLWRLVPAGCTLSSSAVMSQSMGLTLKKL